MNNQIQTTLSVSNKNEINRAWAFAISDTMQKTKRQHIKDFSDSVISACSKEARILGVKVGMKYVDAKLIIPELKVLVINNNSRRNYV